MSGVHLDDDALLGFLAGNGDLVDLEAVRAHLDGCAPCSKRLLDLKQWEILLSDPEIWSESALRRTTREEGPTAASIGGLFRRLNVEARRAREVLARLPTDDVTAWVAPLAHAEATAGLARALVDAARQHLTTAPERALVVLDAAEDVLRRLQTPARSIEGDLWKERSNAERLRGQYTAALAALDEAENCYEPAAAYDHAFVEWGRGSVYFEMKRFSDARHHLERAISIFQDYGDELRVAQVQVTVGGILFDEGAVSAARDRFAASELVIAAFGDDETLARIFSNLATCDIRLGRTESAREYVEKATSLFDALEMDTEAVRLLWSLGEALLALGRPDDALQYINDVAERFERLGMIGEAIHARCDTLALLLQRGDADEAVRIATRAAAYFTRVGADIDAANALDYLRRATLAMRATPKLVVQIREFVAARLRGDAGMFEPSGFEKAN
jgi:tetratricopeptide (TPR) repeat protein